MLSTYIEWDGALQNSNFERIDNRLVAWSGYANDTRFGSDVSVESVAGAALRGHYSFQVVEDEALFRMQYEFSTRGRHLLSAHLGYYSVRRSVSQDEIDDAQYSVYSEQFQSNSLDADDPTATLDDTGSSDQIDSNNDEFFVDSESGADIVNGESDSVSWLRIDYDPHQERGPLHAPCHLHFSGFPEARLMVHGVPTPRQFVDLVMSIQYPEIFKRHLDASGNVSNAGRFQNLHGDQLECVRPASLDLMSHLRIAGFN